MGREIMCLNIKINICQLTKNDTIKNMDLRKIQHTAIRIYQNALEYLSEFSIKYMTSAPALVGVIQQASGRLAQVRKLDIKGYTR